MEMKNLTTIGRVIFALPLIFFGLSHFMRAGDMAGFVPAYFPGGGAIWVYLVGLILLLAGLGILLNKKVKECGYAIAILMIIFILTLHLPGMSNPETMQFAMVNLLKDTMILGAALMIAAGCSCSCKNCTTCQAPTSSTS